MKNTINRFLSTLLSILLMSSIVLFSSVSQSRNASEPLDYNEITHLQFMREEEKLARDVYITLGEFYPEAQVFSNITKSEENHTTTVKYLLDKYGVTDPSEDDAVGVFTGNEWGWYFIEKYEQLVNMGKDSLLSALYVGALIEELDMHDIVVCPDVIVEQSDEIEDENQCGQVYTDEKAIDRVYDGLLHGSAFHLNAFVYNIEKFIGEGNYEAQYLTQEEVDYILGRRE
jgi:hypothetical protein